MPAMADGWSDSLSKDMQSTDLNHVQATSNSSMAFRGRFRSAWNFWLAINKSWTSKWWYAAVHNITAVIGAGVLSLHASMADLGWVPGILALCLVGVISLSTMWQMIELHEVDGQRLDRYHELGQKAFGKKLGIWIVVPLQMLVEVGVDTVYLLTAAKSLRKVYSLIHGCHDSNDDSCGPKLHHYTIIFAAVQVCLSQLPNFTSITWVSIIAALTSISYSTIAWVAALVEGRQDNVSYKYPKTSAANGCFGVFRAIGQIAFAFAGHNVVMEIQATIPSTVSKPSKIPAWNGALAAYTVMIFCYFPNALVGYYVFGNRNHEDKHILEILRKPVWLVAAGNIMVVLHMCGGFQIFALPLFDNVETFLTRKAKFREGLSLRLIVRTCYVAFTCFLAVSVPFFSDLLAFVGGVAFVPTTFLLPCIIWHILRRPRTLGLPWLANWACIVLGVLLTVTSTVGGFRNILQKASDYKFYQ